MEELNYKEALAELEAILNRLRNDACDVDDLARQTLRATELLNVCRQRLTTTEAQLQDILKSLQTPQA